MSFRAFRGFVAAALVSGAAALAPAALFEPLFVVERAVGAVTVEKPDGTVVPAEAEHAYPYGSKITVPDVPPPLTPEEIKSYEKQGLPLPPQEVPVVRIRFSSDFAFRLGANTKVAILDASEQTDDGLKEVKILDLARGSVDTFITASVVKTGGAADAKVEEVLSSIIVRTPCGDASRMAARNRISVTPSEDTPGYSTCVFRTQSGMMDITGPQFHIKDMKQNAEAILDGNLEFTSINIGNSEFTTEFERGADNTEKVRFSGRTTGKIWRQYCDVGGRKAMAVMVSRTDGSLISYSYLEGQTGIADTVAGTAAETHALPPAGDAQPGAEAAGLDGGASGDGFDADFFGTETSTTTADDGLDFDWDF